MKRVFLAAVSTVAGLTMLLQFKTRATPTAAAPAPTPSPANDITPTTAAGTRSSTSTGTKTVTGDAASTRYGPVQVKLTVTHGKVAAVQAIEYPTGSRRDQQINAYAIPALNQEATAAKSANIDMISGATYTSTGYVDSLQSALNKAGLA
jgi:uncharacterized protein with FMN-binding domain